MKITVTYHPGTPDEDTEVFTEKTLVPWADNVLREQFNKSPMDNTVPSLKQCFKLMDLLKYTYEVDYEPRCYVYTCRSTENLRPPVRPHEKWEQPVQYCEECHALDLRHSAACKDLGIEAWDETFVVFRAGALSQHDENFRLVLQDIRHALENDHHPQALYLKKVLEATLRTENGKSVTEAWDKHLADPANVV